MHEPVPPGSDIARLRADVEAAESAPARLCALLALAEAESGIDARRALDLVERAAVLAHDLGDDHAQAEATYMRGRCADLLLDHEVALAAYGSALAAFEAQGNDLAVAKTLRSTSFVHDALGDIPQALDLQFRALAIDQRMGNDTGHAATLRTIGVVYSRSGDAVTGLDFYRRSLALCTRPADAVERAKTQNNIGINLKNLGQLEESRAALDEAHELFKQLGMPLQQSATLNNLGLVEQRMGDEATAEQTLRRALTLSETTGYRYGVAHASLSLGRLCAGQERHDEAFAWLRMALDVCEQHNLKPTLGEAHEALSGLHAATGDPQAALDHFRRFHTLEREVQSDAARDKLRAMQIQLELAAARREADLQRERQVALTRANAELDALNVSLTEANLAKTMLLDKLERQTYEDVLTGLANRRRLEQRLSDEFALALRHGRPLTVAMADLDHFKAVNDRFSHAVGDATLRATSRILAGHVRHTDLVARFGGEEFVIVLAETDAQAALGVCEKLRAAVAQHNWGAIHPGLALTISIGLSSDTGVATAERMLALADRNLYTAKARGRNRVVGDGAA